MKIKHLWAVSVVLLTAACNNPVTPHSENTSPTTSQGLSHWPVTSMDHLNGLSQITPLVGVALKAPVTLQQVTAAGLASDIQIRVIYYNTTSAQGTFSQPEAVLAQQATKELESFLKSVGADQRKYIEKDLALVAPAVPSQKLSVQQAQEVQSTLQAQPKTERIFQALVKAAKEQKDLTAAPEAAIVYGLQVKGNKDNIRKFASLLGTAGIQTDHKILFSGMTPALPESLSTQVEQHDSWSLKVQKLETSTLAQQAVEAAKAFGINEVQLNTTKEIKPQAVTGPGNPYPNRGTLYYVPYVDPNIPNRDNIRYTMAWDNPGGFWSGPARGDGRTHPGIFEMDFLQTGNRQTFDTGCISYSNLPQPYDDCPTSGASESGGTVSHGLGSWNISAVTPSGIYNATVQLKRFFGVTGKQPFKVSWGTMQHDLCSSPINPNVPHTYNGSTYYTCQVAWPAGVPEPAGGQICYFTSTERNIWCVIGARSGVLLNNTTGFTLGSSYSESWRY